MKFTKKSLLLGIAALGALTVAGSANATLANAKSYAKVVSNTKLTTPSTLRNVNFTGGSALYTKAGTLKGAKKVANQSTLMSLANSNISQNNVRAYQVAKTNRGSVYYKVVTFNGQYRGWIYGGKSVSSFAGGLTNYTTFDNQFLSTLTTAQQNATYKIANPGVTNDGKTVTYKEPAWTQYKVGRAITDSSPYANSQFKIDKVGTRTREKDQWVHIVDTTNANSPANGWILFSGLTPTSTPVAPVADNAIRINLVDPSNNSTVVKTFDYVRNGAAKGSQFGSFTNNAWTIPSSDQSAIEAKIRSELSGTNYNLSSLSSSQVAQIAQATFGGSVNIAVNKTAAIADNAVRINLLKPDGTFLKSTDWVKNGATKGKNVGSSVSNSTLWTLDSNDQSSITNQINSALSNSGYSLANNTLTAAQVDTIARGSFGGSVDVYVVAVQKASTTIVPKSAAIGDPFNQTTLQGTTETYSTANASVPTFGQPNNFNSKDLVAQKASDSTSLVARLNTVDAADRAAKVDLVNKALYNAAATQYNSTGVKLDGFTGPSGQDFNAVDLLTYLYTNGLGSLKTPQFVQYVITNGVVTQKNDNVINFIFPVNLTGSKYGSPVNVVYNFNPYTSIVTK
ncbi:S-layer protein precursor [Lentilactobacillus sunkii]|uniref:S-layer protein n=1 Tax=Lentilactobacillus sunkii TaxID=481719 RepID=A0A1E7X9W5_9LACO|nr:S-layer family protein [Lentilactobacillus sunkii]OFA09801.1 S-layer protein precursor [Lentilactobacillus sunkii]